MADDQQTRIARLEREFRDHMKHCQTEFKAGSDKFDRIMQGVEDLGDKIDSCTQEVCKLKANTDPVVKLYDDVVGAANTMSRLQTLVLSLAKWIGIPTVVYTALKWLFTKGPPLT